MQPDATLPGGACCPRNAGVIANCGRLASAASVFVVLVGVSVLAGWAFDIEEIKSVLPGSVAMKVNTAVCLTLAGVVLWLLRAGQAAGRALWSARAGACIVAGVGLATFVEFLFGADFGIDQLLIAEAPEAPGTVVPGRMSPSGAFGFLLFGAALYLLSVKARGCTLLGQIFALFNALVGCLALIGYLYGVQRFYGIAQATNMAILTALSYIVLALGILCARPGAGLMAVATSATVGGVVFRRLFPVALLAPVAIGWITLQGRIQGQFGTEFGLALFALSSVIVFASLTWWLAARLAGADTRRMQAVDALHKLNADLDQCVARRTAELDGANRELESFSYSVSHDLRAPLRAIDGFSRILLDEHAAELSGDGRNYLDLVVENTRQMGKLIDDLLDFSRLSRKEVCREPVVVGELVSECLDALHAGQDDAGAEIVVGDLPQCDGDRSLLKQVWMNLLSNALKYSKKRADPHVEIGCDATNGRSVYFVRDNGVGFDMRYADKLFSVFQRLHRAEDYEGTGVGLAIVQRIVRRHGGDVWAEAVPDRGATFFFTLQPEGANP